jgi:hypothetical protein
MSLERRGQAQESSGTIEMLSASRTVFQLNRLNTLALTRFSLRHSAFRYSKMNHSLVDSANSSLCFS